MSALFVELPNESKLVFDCEVLELCLVSFVLGVAGFSAETLEISEAQQKTIKRAASTPTFI